MKKETLSIIGHELVPEHVVINETEVKELLDKYKIKRVQLPKIKVSDPAINGLGAEIGDVVEITRQSRTAGISLSFRLVIG